MRNKLDEKYVKIAVTIFIAGAALILFYSAVTNMGDVKKAVSNFGTILSPFVYGLIMAYLLCPIYNAVVRRMYSNTKDGFKNKRKALRFARVGATVISMMLLIGVIGGLIWLVLPEFIRSIVGIIQMLPERLDYLNGWISDSVTGDRHSAVANIASTLIEQFKDRFVHWAQNEFLPGIGSFMTRVTTSIIMTIRTMLNILIGMIVCVYFLNSKELFKAQAKKIISASFNRKNTEDIMEFAYFCNRTFGGFINGKIIDSIIIGIICFILMFVIGMPYPVLVSTIIGVTNIIPFFGPFIGAIPGSIIICLVSPLDALYFLILIFILQQFDGNILGPKILGETTGLASFWVMFAIIVGGGLFGFAGMLLGVPTFAVIYYYFSRFIRRRLEMKSMPADTTDYEDFNKYDINREDIL